ncbi:hypothetical protein BGZ95_011123 [Linnemannia exigua]|uniref:Uncharacterized protein n=1 Tax=Linnemannia exigua TaxID=604196 RepID=A0AAD4DCE1_9FUNG|nr:hypothetical protein BGZ95_011123 [Linnemannia exigua]
MKLLAAALLGTLAVMSTTQGFKKWVDPDPVRGPRVAAYIACIGPCIQEAVSDPLNEDCHMEYPNPKKCLATLQPKFLPCVEKCTGRTLTEPVPDTNTTVPDTAPAGYIEDMEAMKLQYF